MASTALSVANSSVHVSNNKGSFSEFTGLQTSSAVPFRVRRKNNDDLLSLVAFQTSVNNSRVVEAKLKVAINRFGRIGRNFLRCWHGRTDSPLDVIAIIDSSGVKQDSHLLKYDSTLGIFDADVKPVGTDGISIDGKLIKVVSNRNPINLPWKDLGVDLVIEGTRVFVDREGAGKISKLELRKSSLLPPEKVILVPLSSVSMHTFTALMSPSSTMLLAPPIVLLLLSKSLTKNLLNGIALCVPTPDVSVVDLVVQVSKKTFAKEANAAFREFANKELADILSVCDEPLVSFDFRCSDVSSILYCSLTMVM
ncbi:hypothetical protein RDI58_003899 [Solanum bulbocastanum]|uniref:Glyceraldehyde 3-phosphate dehydrogenase NAD(P) binding domain-containing protein n=1 Tax=Solanum bulbocastanum TaxID=147425 RepID=A0AAN8YPE4_SOLBU